MHWWSSAPKARIETTSKQSSFRYIVVSICPARFDFVITPLSATGLLDHRNYFLCDSLFDLPFSSLYFSSPHVPVPLPGRRFLPRWYLSLRTPTPSPPRRRSSPPTRTTFPSTHRLLFPHSLPSHRRTLHYRPLNLRQRLSRHRSSHPKRHAHNIRCTHCSITMEIK